MADGTVPGLPPRKEPIKLTPVRWAEDGLQVWIYTSRTTALRCTIACACGDLARIIHERNGINKWMKLDDLYVLKGDPHGYD